MVEDSRQDAPGAVAVPARCPNTQLLLRDLVILVLLSAWQLGVIP